MLINVVRELNEYDVNPIGKYITLDKHNHMVSSR